MCFYCISSSCIRSVTNIKVPCSKARGRPRKTWSDCVKADMNVCSLGCIDPQNRTAWRSGTCIRSSGRLLPTPATWTNRSSRKIKSGFKLSLSKLVCIQMWLKKTITLVWPLTNSITCTILNTKETFPLQLFVLFLCICFCSLSFVVVESSGESRKCCWIIFSIYLKPVLKCVSIAGRW